MKVRLILLVLLGLPPGAAAPRYSLWGAVTSGGGVKVTKSYTLMDSTGQVAVGRSCGSRYCLKAGFLGGQ